MRYRSQERAVRAFDRRSPIFLGSIILGYLLGGRANGSVWAWIARFVWLGYPERIARPRLGKIFELDRSALDERLDAKDSLACTKLAMREEARRFRERADAFLDTALYNLSKGRYDLAAFCAEQAIQLYAEAKLPELVGEFPRTHDVIFLLRETSKIHGGEVIGRFVDENIRELASLQDVYITSRYYLRDFYEEEVRELVDLARRVRELLYGSEG